jgi:hypothetical protein
MGRTSASSLTWQIPPESGGYLFDPFPATAASAFRSCRSALIPVLPEGARWDLRLLSERRFGDGMVYAHLLR